MYTPRFNYKFLYWFISDCEMNRLNTTSPFQFLTNRIGRSVGGCNSELLTGKMQCSAA